MPFNTRTSSYYQQRSSNPEKWYGIWRARGLSSVLIVLCNDTSRLSLRLCRVDPLGMALFLFGTKYSFFFVRRHASNAFLPTCSASGSTSVNFALFRAFILGFTCHVQSSAAIPRRSGADQSALIETGDDGRCVSGRKTIVSTVIQLYFTAGIRTISTVERMNSVVHIS